MNLNFKTIITSLFNIRSANSFSETFILGDNMSVQHLTMTYQAISLKEKVLLTLYPIGIGIKLRKSQEFVLRLGLNPGFSTIY